MLCFAPNGGISTTSLQLHCNAYPTLGLLLGVFHYDLVHCGDAAMFASIPHQEALFPVYTVMVSFRVSSRPIFKNILVCGFLILCVV